MTDFDFIPPAYHAAALRRRTQRAQLTWGAVLAAAIVGWGYSHQARVAEARADLDTVREEWAQLESRRRVFDQLSGERDELLRLENAWTELDDRASLAVVLAELSALMPDGTVLTDLSIEIPPTPRPTATAAPAGAPGATPGSAPGAAPVPGAAQPAQPHAAMTRLRLVGAAESNNFYSALAARLSGSPLLRNVNTSTIKEAVFAGRQVLQFEVECDALPHREGPK